MDVREAVAANRHWYHTLELAPGVVTPGHFDLRPVVDRLPWPDVRGKRCLDVGTYDGFMAFELERRGAREVVATDLSDHAQWDWPADVVARGPGHMRDLARFLGPKGEGFETAHRALDSSVEKVEVSVYDLGPERLGTFDVVVCGSLMLHLREPVRALEAIRSVCGGELLSAEEISLRLTLLHPRRPLAALNGVGDLCQWWTPNAAGHRRMLRSAGFEVLRHTRPYVIPFGTGHPPRGRVAGRLRGDGVPHAAALARPAL
ncbi:MAG: tRNA (mo5U34)-methyltransferase [Solirubrobacteraceae bacterium]|nr:tRNA (mo5U34)-methyltransferase [Solirubrobacteraceae bacterium]